jgi:large subunit ribosomal protein L25
MNKQVEIAAEERAVLGKHVKLLRRQGIVPANLDGRKQPSLALQVSDKDLQKLLARGGSKVILLKVGDQPAIQALLKRVQLNPVTGKASHVEFHRVSSQEKLKTPVRLRFVNEPAMLPGNASISRSLSEVMVECLPADLPNTIEVDLSQLTEANSLIRVGNLTVGPGLTILTDQNDVVASVHKQAPVAEAEGPEAVPSTSEAAASETTEPSGTEAQNAS